MRQEVIDRLDAATKVVTDAADRQKAAASAMIDSIQRSNGQLKAALTLPSPGPGKK